MRGTPLGMRLFKRPAAVAAAVASAWNPLDKSTNLVLSNVNRTATSPATVAAYAVRGDTAITGKKYFEIQPTLTSGQSYVGVSNLTYNITPFDNPYATTDTITYSKNGFICYNAGFTNVGAWVDGDVLGFAVDQPNGLVWFSKNNTWLAGDPSAGTGGSSTAQGAFYPLLYMPESSAATIRTTAAQISGTVPTGFTVLS